MLTFDSGKWGGMYEFDVKYSPVVPQFDISKISNQIETLICLVGTKSQVWKHEKEHRLLFDKGGACLKIDYRAIKGFVFGCRMPQGDIDYVMKQFAGRDLEYSRVELIDNTYELSLKRQEDKYPNADKYYPNKISYDLDHLLECDKYSLGVGYKYKGLVDEALKEVCREPFVTGISHIVVTDDGRYPHIMVWTSIDQPGVIRKMRAFDYDIEDGKLVKSE